MYTQECMTALEIRHRKAKRLARAISIELVSVVCCLNVSCLDAGSRCSSSSSRPGSKLRDTNVFGRFDEYFNSNQRISVTGRALKN